jgi:predicted GNAT family N-acyltransferase
VYYVIENASGEVVGGAGIAPLKGGEPGVCELQKMYFMPEVRGLGFGQKLLDLCLSRAEEFGYRICYLESLESMKTAAALYLKNGFKKLSFGLGNTGHHACNSWYAKVLGEGFTAKLVTSEEEISSILEMRREVFVVEQKIPDDLEWDEPKEELAQFVVFHGEFPVSTGRLRVVDDKVKFERILTRKAYRHQGVGRVLMEAMMQYARQQYPGLKFLLNSQLSAKPFYESLGWQAIGDQFYEADIPHYTMIL